MDIFDRSAVHNNVLDATRAARLAALEATRRNVILNQLSNASDIIGEVDYPAVDENGVLRMIMSANNLLERFGISAHFAGFADDGVTPTVWIDADLGGLTALLGNLIIDADGLTIYGTTLAQYFEATEGEETRRAFLGQYLPQGETIPNFAIIFAGPVGSNLISNGDAETGDLTDWTDTDGAWTVDEDAYEGDYSFLHDGTAEAFPGYLEQNVAVTAGETVTFAFKHKRRAGILAGRYRLDWLTSAPAVISTDYMYGNPSSGWTVIEQAFTVPATAVSVDVVFEPGDPFNDELVDDVQLYVQNVSNELRFSDDSLKAIVNGTEYDLLGGSAGDVLYASNARTNIDATGSGSTTVFSVVLPANFFTDNQLVFEVDSFLDQNATNRTFTGVLTVGSKTVTISMGGGGSNVISDWNHKGAISKGGTDNQDIAFEASNIANATSTTANFHRKKDNATETETGAITVSLTLSLSGSADFCYFMGVRVKKVPNT